MQNNDHYDKTLNLTHGEWVICQFTKKKAFQFRFGPVDRGSYRYHFGRNRKAFGSLRRPKTQRSMKWAEAHQLEGIRVRPAERNLPTVWDDIWAHAEKNWKRHRRTQFKAD